MYKLLVIVLVILLSPLLLLISILIALTSGLPIVYKQKRVGQNERVFTLYKFRTMNQEADQLKMHLRSQNEADGPVFKIYEDPRFTAVGRWLSHTGLDELPQLINILKGEMALIGPRPLPLDEVRKLTLWQKKRHRIKPGIMSPWILNGYHSQSFADWMRSDLAYIQKKSFLHDTSLSLKTPQLIARLFVREVQSILNKK